MNVTAQHIYTCAPAPITETPKRAPQPFEELEGDELFVGRLTNAVRAARERAALRDCRQKLRVCHDPVSGRPWLRTWVLQDVR